jgi:hypothetical protein
MDTASGAETPDQRDEGRFSAALDELTTIRDEVVKMKDWYEKHARRPMIWFRAVGVAIILLSVSVPFLGALKGDGVWTSVVLPICTLAIAGLAGINAFFQWQTQWQEFRQAQLALEYLLSKWELEIFRARRLPDEDRAIEMAVEATDKFLDSAREATAKETGRYLESVRLPDTQ